MFWLTFCSGQEDRTLTTLVTEAPLAAIDTHTPSSGVKSGVVGIFFQSCANLFWELTREAHLLHQLSENHRLAFRKSFEKFYIWGTGFNPERGELDEILNLSASLKEQTVSLLAKIAVILCSNEKGDSRSSDLGNIRVLTYFFARPFLPTK